MLLAAVLFFLVVFLIKISIIVYLSTILLGLFIIACGNIICKINLGKFASVLWNLAAVGLTICSTVMLWKDLGAEAADYGAIPFVILLVFGLASMFLFAAVFVSKATKNKRALKNSRKAQKVKVTQKPKKVSKK